MAYPYIAQEELLASELNADLARVTIKLGDGSDGDVTIDASSDSYAFGSLDGTVFTLSRDIYADDLTVDSGYTLRSNGFKIFAKGTLLNNGTIHRNGNNAAGATAGAALAAGTLPGALAGVTGKAGQRTYGDHDGGVAGGGDNGVDITHSIVSGTCKVGGLAGGGGGNQPDGGANGANANPGEKGVITPADENANFQDFNSLAYKGLEQDGATLYFLTLSASNGGAAGGGGGANNDPGTLGPAGGAGGGGGGNAGLLIIFCRTLTNNGIISANGGGGGDGGDGGGGGAYGAGGGGGGGAGGNGGYVLLVYMNKTASGTVTASAGAKGTKGSGGAGNYSGVDGGDGEDGIAGTVEEINIMT